MSWSPPSMSISERLFQRLAALRKMQDMCHFKWVARPFDAPV